MPGKDRWPWATLFVPIGGKGNQKGKAEASSWFRSEVADMETDVEIGRTSPSFMVGFFEEILVQGRR